MKIIRLSTFLDFGGVERRLINIAHVQDTNEWLFCAIGKGGKAEQLIKQQNKRVICFNWPHQIPSFQTIYRLYGFFKRERPDVVHCSGAEANFFGVTAAKLAGVKTIIAEEIGLPSQGRIARFVFRFIFRNANYVVGNSKKVLGYLELQNKVKKAKLKLIPNPIIFPPIKDRSEQDDQDFNLISISRLEPVKNLESIFRVLARLKKEGIKLTYSIVGTGSLMDKLKQDALDLEILDRVSFMGFQSDPYPLLLRSDLYLLVSFSEGFSNSLVEAMYSGTPSLSTRVGAAEEIISDGVNGWLVDVDNDDALYAKIKNIMGLDEKERDRIAERGKEHVIHHYSLENHLEHLMRIYHAA